AGPGAGSRQALVAPARLVPAVQRTGEEQLWTQPPARHPADGDGDGLAGNRQRLNWDAVLEKSGVKLLAEVVKEPWGFISAAVVDAVHGRKSGAKASANLVAEINGLLRENGAGYIFAVDDKVKGKGFKYESTGAEGDRLLSMDEIPDVGRTQLRSKRRWD